MRRRAWDDGSAALGPARAACVLRFAAAAAPEPGCLLRAAHRTRRCLRPGRAAAAPLLGGNCPAAGLSRRCTASKGPPLVSSLHAVLPCRCARLPLPPRSWMAAGLRDGETASRLATRRIRACQCHSGAFPAVQPPPPQLPAHPATRATPLPSPPSALGCTVVRIEFGGAGWAVRAVDASKSKARHAVCVKRAVHTSCGFCLLLRREWT